MPEPIVAPPAPPEPVLHAVKSPGILSELKLLSESVSIKRWPMPLNVVLSLIDGLLTVLNQTTIAGVGFHFPTAAQTAVTLALGAFAWLGVGPVTGPKFAAAFKIPPKIMGAISMLMLIGLTVGQQELGPTDAAVVLAAINVLGGLGFEPASVPTI